MCVFTLSRDTFYVCCWKKTSNENLVKKINAKQLQSHFGLTIDVSVFSGTDGGLRLCSAPGPGIRDGQNSYSRAGQDRWSPDHAAHMTYEGYYNGTHWEQERGKLSQNPHCRQNGILMGHLQYVPQDEEN